MEQQELIPHLFRSEFSKIVSVLSRSFGIANLELAEDITSETFLSALETWTYSGVPANPIAWLYAVARNKAKNRLVRDKIFQDKVGPEVKRNSERDYELSMDMSEPNIKDSQLRMLFAICHPSISPEAQIGLSLRILCGFGIDEISNALLTPPETISKRLVRAKEKLRTEKIELELPNGSDIDSRLDTVLTTLYLLFSEGYYSESDEAILREELCLEAMRLTYLLVENTMTNKPKVNALMALMCFHASRFPARRAARNAVILYDDQDASLWNYELIAKGAEHLNIGSNGVQLSRYHIEANIAYWHTIKKDSPEKWENILQLYNRLLMTEYSPVAALNRTYALFKVHGAAVAIQEAEKLRLINNHFYYILLAELYKEGDAQQAVHNYERAIELTKTKTEREDIRRKILKLKSDQP